MSSKIAHRTVGASGEELSAAVKRAKRTGGARQKGQNPTPKNRQAWRKKLLGKAV